MQLFDHIVGGVNDGGTVRPMGMVPLDVEIEGAALLILSR
jgi:hypothetical protein